MVQVVTLLLAHGDEDVSEAAMDVLLEFTTHKRPPGERLLPAVRSRILESFLLHSLKPVCLCEMFLTNYIGLFTFMLFLESKAAVIHLCL